MTGLEKEGSMGELEVTTVSVVVGLDSRETGSEEDGATSDSEVEGTLVLPSMENLLGDALQQSVPPLSSGRFLSQQ